MSEKLRAFLGTAVMLAREVPGAIDVLDSKARQLIKLRDDFRGTHWGSEEDMHATTRVRVPDVSKGIVAMGPLVSLVYLATKGGGLYEWEHEFTGSRPILAYAHDGSGLVIVRGDSDYTVTKKGIEG